MHAPTLLRAYWDIRSLCEDLLDVSMETDEERLIDAIETYLLGHCSICGALLERNRRRQRMDTPLCLVCETVPQPPPPRSRPEPSDTPF